MVDFDALRKAHAGKDVQPGGRHAPTNASPAAFTQALQRAQTGTAANPPDGALAALLADIDAASARFLEQYAPDALIEYKQTVRRFLEEFLARSHARQQIANFDPQAPHDYVLLVRTIDEKLETLSRQFVTQEATQLQFLALIDEIRGLLMDLDA